MRQPTSTTTTKTNQRPTRHPAATSTSAPAIGRRVARVALAAFAALLASAALGAASASAGVIGWNDPDGPGEPTLQSDTLDYVDQNDGPKHLTVTYGGGHITFHDSLAQLELEDVYYSNDPQCDLQDSHTVTCVAGNITKVRFWLGNTHDYLDYDAPVATQIWGQDGNDTIYGGSGYDAIYGGEGDDKLYDRGGNDSVHGEAGQDLLVAGIGSDVMSGGPGTDKVSYQGRQSFVKVSLDNKTNDGQTGEQDNVSSDVENLQGGEGGDTLAGDGDANVISGKEGPDTITGNGGDDTLYGGDSGDILYGNSGADKLIGGPGNDELWSGTEDDEMWGGPGADEHFGGPGVDTANFADHTGAVTVDLDWTFGDDGEAGEGDTVYPNVENVIGGHGDDTLIGSDAANKLEGGDQGDKLTGGLGPDVLKGQDGNDTLLSKDGVVDTDDCGAGNADKATADANDVLILCEQVTKSGSAQLQSDPQPQQSSPEQSSEQQGSDAPSDSRPGPEMQIVSIRPGRRGRARVKVKCLSDTRGACKGKLTLKRHGKKVGARRFKIATGKTKVVKVKLRRRARRALKRNRRLRVTAIAKAHDALGQSETTRATLTMRLAKHN
jgi:Ca2+-binding RTX toxin-like protein